MADDAPPDARFQRLCPLAELPSGKRRAFEIDGRPILVLRVGREVFAIDNRCTHLDFPLDNGRQIGFELICRHHGARFDIRTGEAKGGPAVLGLRTYPARIEGDWVEVAGRDQTFVSTGGRTSIS